MVNLRAVKKFGNLSPGDIFSKTKTDANLLALLGVAEIVTEEAEPEQVAAVQAEKSSVKKKKTSAKTSGSSRTYRRRDMVAE